MWFWIFLVIVIWRFTLPSFCVADGGLGFSNSLVFKEGDTLKFYKNDSLINQRVLQRIEYSEEGGYYIERAGISPDNKRFFICEEEYSPEKDSIFTKLNVYNSDQKRIYSRVESGKRRINAELTKVYPDKIIIFITDRLGDNPVMEIIKNNKTKKTVHLKQWTSIANYTISQNGRYILFHAKKPYNNKLWDYIYSLDLETNKSWEYLFPFCFSCKRGWIDLKIDNDGKSEVIYRNEHRIFDRDGNLIDVFVKLD